MIIKIPAFLLHFPYGYDVQEIVFFHLLAFIGQILPKKTNRLKKNQKQNIHFAELNCAYLLFSLRSFLHVLFSFTDEFFICKLWHQRCCRY